MKVFRPETIAEAAALLSEDENLKLVAGGTDLIPRINQKFEKHAGLVFIGAYPETSGVREEEDGRIFIGASEKLSGLEKCTALAGYPALLQAAGRVASPQIRNQATIGGNILQENRCMYFNNQVPWSDVNHCFKWGGAQCFQYPKSRICMALFQSDVAPVLIAYGASVRIIGNEGLREMPVGELYLPGGKKNLKHDEIVTGVLLPALTKGDTSVYVRWTLRGSFDFPLLGCAVVMNVKDGECKDCRIVFGAAGIKPQAFPAGAEAFIGKRIEEFSDIAAGLAEEAGKKIMAFRDTHVDGEVRREKAGVLLKAALEKLAGQTE